MIGIYKFTNKITGESYIGQSSNIARRYKEHRNRFDNFNKNTPKEDTYFHSMLRHYGFDNFDFEIIEECSTNSLNEREVFYIAFYNTLYPNGYNKSQGGNLPHTNAIKDLATIKEIQQLLKTSTLSNSDIGTIYGVSDQTISDINTGRTWFNTDIEYPIRKRKHGKLNQCVACGKTIKNNTETNLCSVCFHKSQRKVVNRPSKEALYDLLLKYSFLYVGKMFDVSDNAVRKWCKLYNIPKESKYYRSLAQ